ncbi:MAG TPA: hypothetical protein VGC87_19115 [Pyrinomonadaceae bacterium]|jgi:hypothetical protein
MNPRKHLAGFTIFSIILGTAILINYYLTLPAATIPPVSLEPPAVDEVEVTQPINSTVRLVSLDFINGKSYTTLVLNKPEAGGPVPEIVEVTTVFYVPDGKNGPSRLTRTRILRPFDAGGQVEVTAAADCGWCSSAYVPKAGYFAYVYVRGLRAGRTYLPDLKPETVVKTEVPVVVQAPPRPVR